jgi:ribosome-binding factor A
MPASRMRRVNEVMREVIGVTIGEELQDPRIGFVTVTAVDTSSDLRTARVHVSVLGTDEEKEATMAALKAARGVIQGAISSQLSMKRTPTLTFLYDESIERADRLNRMLRP